MVDTELIEMNMTQFLPLKNSWSNGEGKHINANIQKNGTSVEMKVSKGAIWAQREPRSSFWDRGDFQGNKILSLYFHYSAH